MQSEKQSYTPKTCEYSFIIDDYERCPSRHT